MRTSGTQHRAWISVSWWHFRSYNCIVTVRAASESSSGALIALFWKHKQGLMMCAVLGDQNVVSQDLQGCSWSPHGRSWQGCTAPNAFPSPPWSTWRCPLAAVNSVLCRVVGDHLEWKALFKVNTWWHLVSSCFPCFRVLRGACTPSSVPWQQAGMIGPAALHRQDCSLCCRKLCVWGKN